MGKLATLLGKCNHPSFHVTQRSVRDKYRLIERQYKKKINEEDTRASRISPEVTKINQSMQEIAALLEEEG